MAIWLTSMMRIGDSLLCVWLRSLHGCRGLRMRCLFQNSVDFHGSVSFAGPGTIRVLGPKKRTAFAEGFGHRVAIASTSYNNDLVDFKSVEGVKVFQSPGGQAELLVKVRLSVIMINLKL